MRLFHHCLHSLVYSTSLSLPLLYSIYGTCTNSSVGMGQCNLLESDLTHLIYIRLLARLPLRIGSGLPDCSTFMMYVAFDFSVVG